MVHQIEFDQANARAQDQRNANPMAVSAGYDRRISRVVICLSDGSEIHLNPHDVQGLETAHPSDLVDITISPSGLGLHFPKLDADLYLPALLKGTLGSKQWIAAKQVKQAA